MRFFPKICREADRFRLSLTILISEGGLRSLAGLWLPLDLKIEASSGKSVGDGERQRAVPVRNRRNLLQVESKDRC